MWRAVCGLSFAAGALGACGTASTSGLCPTMQTCTDTTPRGSCADLKVAAGGCKQLIDDYQFTQCAACTCAPGTYDPNPPDPVTGSCTGKGECSGGLTQAQSDVLVAKANIFRTAHGSCPIAYNAALSGAALQSSGFQQTCSTGVATPNADPAYTWANYASPPVKSDIHNYDAALAVQQWYCGEEGCWDSAAGAPVAGQTADSFTALLWNASSEVGCAMCQRPSGGTSSDIYVFCAFGPAGNTAGAYAENVFAEGTPRSGCAVDAVDECLTKGCNSAKVTCNDPNHLLPDDFICTCVDYPSVFATGEPPAVCEIDECIPDMCGADQTCVDPNKAADALGDRICVCNSDSTVFARDKDTLTCPVDECAASSADCGSTQTCTDAKQYTTGDYVCTCRNGVALTGGPAVCTRDECEDKPCGSDQTCADQDTSAAVLKDFVCSCDANTAVVRTGEPAPCPVDECVAAPCGPEQACNDPDPSPLSMRDFVCTCGNSVTATGAAAVCDGDECTLTPCAAGQACNDPTKTRGNRGDFTCTCNNDASLVKVGAPVPSCVSAECDTLVCGPGSGQTCSDPNPSSSSLNDYTCTCPNGVSSVGRPAVCTPGPEDECVLEKPCGPGQGCTDPVQIGDRKQDFVCSCIIGTGDGTVGKPAVCTKDECDAEPCAPGQTCSDASKDAASAGDYTCTCPSPQTGSSIGMPAQCVLDECSVAPCGMRQTCHDPNHQPAASHDFVCACIANNVTATGKAATCVIDECGAFDCGVGQRCEDPNTSAAVLQDFTCTCDAAPSVYATGTVAVCELDECLAQPCESEQTCTDSDTSFSATGDFVCLCPGNSGMKVGGNATCVLDECTANPCGTNQNCTDPAAAYASRNDFVCVCQDDPSVRRTGGAAPCTVDECVSTPCGTDQACIDPTAAVGSYICSCVGNPSLREIGKRVPTCGEDECVAKPCAEGQACVDPGLLVPGDFVCTCPTGQTQVGAPVPACDECNTGGVGNPCRWYGHPAVIETCHDPDPRATSRNDFVCMCLNGVSSIGGPAECEKTGECAASPCGARQVCSDLDLNVDGDFTCSCPDDDTAIGGPAPACREDECASVSPCPEATQTCVDLDTSFNSLRDFVCTCKDAPLGGRIVGEALGQRAVCSPLPTGQVPPTSQYNECMVDGGPCGAGQTCEDPTGFKTLKDFTCTCADGSVAVGHSCTKDECAGSSPCSAAIETCVDLNTSFSSLMDYVCTCKDREQKVDGEARGARPVCTPREPGKEPFASAYNECLIDGGPCGDAQRCEDSTGLKVLQDFKCVCNEGKGERVGAPVKWCEPSDDGRTLWVWFVVGGSVLCLCLGLFCLRHRRGGSKDGWISVNDFHHQQTDIHRLSTSDSTAALRDHEFDNLYNQDGRLLV